MICEFCKRDQMKDLTQGLGETRNLYCSRCRAHFYLGRWYSKKEWDEYVEDIDVD